MTTTTALQFPPVFLAWSYVTWGRAIVRAFAAKAAR